MSLQFTLDFLTDLAKHNNKDWMDANKKRYNEAKGYVLEVVEEVIEKTAAFDPGLQGLDPKKTLFRINRDIRFSKNKDPYKTNFGASITEGGRNSGNPGYYLHLMSGNNFIGGGIYQPQAEAIGKIRQEIDYNGDKLRKIINNPTFKKRFDEPYGERLKTAPKGYPKDHVHLDLLQLKSHIFLHQITDKKVTSKGYVDHVVESYKIMHPYIQFIQEALS